MKVDIYTDGSYSSHLERGGLGVVLLHKHHEKRISIGYRRTTNNRMELMAVIVGLKALKSTEVEVTIYSDSKYVVDSIDKRWVNRWNTKPNFANKKNVDLWVEFLKLQMIFKIKMVWVKGHADNYYNEICDQLASKASLGKNLLTDKGFKG
jgi:ribonuclease HI